MTTTGHELGYQGHRWRSPASRQASEKRRRDCSGSSGADVIGLDIATPKVRLRSLHPSSTSVTRTRSLDAAASVGAPLDALFHCAGQPQTAPGLDVLLTGFVGSARAHRTPAPCARDGGLHHVRRLHGGVRLAVPARAHPPPAGAADLRRGGGVVSRQYRHRWRELCPGQRRGQRLHRRAEFRPRPRGHPHQLHQSRPDGDPDDRGRSARASPTT